MALNVAISLKDAILGNHVYIKICYKNFRDRNKTEQCHRVTYSLGSLKYIWKKKHNQIHYYYATEKSIIENIYKSVQSPMHPKKGRNIFNKIFEQQFKIHFTV